MEADTFRLEKGNTVTVPSDVLLHKCHNWDRSRHPDTSRLVRAEEVAEGIFRFVRRGESVMRRRTKVIFVPENIAGRDACIAGVYGKSALLQ